MPRRHQRDEAHEEQGRSTASGARGHRAKQRPVHVFSESEPRAAVDSQGLLRVTVVTERRATRCSVDKCLWKVRLLRAAAMRRRMFAFQTQPGWETFIFPSITHARVTGSRYEWKNVA